MPQAKRWIERRESLMSFADVDGCWIWRGAYNRNGYGTIGREWAHVAMYKRMVGPIPLGMELDHVCRIPACVNPRHLEPVTHAENIRRSPLVGRAPKLTHRKLTDEQVRYVRNSDKSARALGRELGVSRELIRNCRNKTHYREIA